MKDTLKKSLQEKFANECLSDEQLATLMQVQESTLKTKETNRQPWFRYSWVLSVSVTFVLSFVLLFNYPKIKQDMPFAIATEVADNHFKLKPLELESSVLTEVNRYFTKLDFKPISSVLIEPKNLNLLGARYCSLQGVTAVQIRYKNEDGKLVTFYEVPYDKDVYSTFPDIDKGEEPIVSYAKGVGVKIWVEKGLLMAVTL